MLVETRGLGREAFSSGKAEGKLCYWNTCMEEHHCQFVSSRGLARSCDICPVRLVSDDPVLDPEVYREIPAGSVVYVVASQLEAFTREVLPGLKDRFVLVTGDTDGTIPGPLFKRRKVRDRLLENDLIGHWFGQNLGLQHPKVTQIPIGLDYHTLQGEGWKGPRHGMGPNRTAAEQEQELLEVVRSAPLLDERPVRAYANFMFSLNRDRKKALQAIRNKPFAEFQEASLPRKETWCRQAACSFVMSPMGNGVDCHRTWEALALGCIPIVRKSILADLFDGLPVWEVDAWSDVTEDMLTAFKEKAVSGVFSLDKIQLAYWKKAFRKEAEVC